MSSTATLDRPMIIRSAAPLPARPVRPVLRLTRRGRLALVLVVACVALLVTIVGAAAVGAVVTKPAAPATTTVVVQPGQTLWELAEKVAPNKDPREVIKQISDLNALPSAVVSPGQSLRIPTF